MTNQNNEWEAKIESEFSRENIVVPDDCSQNELVYRGYLSRARESSQKAMEVLK